MLRWLLAVLLLGGAGPAGAEGAPATSADLGQGQVASRPATWVATQRVAPAPYELTLPGKVGVLAAAERRALAFQVQGRLETLAEEGSQLAAGEVLAALDTELSRVRLRQAEIRLVDARSEAERLLGLRRLNATSAKQLESADTALALRRADLAAAREELAQRTLLAPFDGVVAETRYEVDEIVAPGRPVVVFLQQADLELEVGLPGYQVSQVVAGARAHVGVPALGGERFQGVVDRVAPAAREGGHLFEVAIRVPNPDGRMRPGMTAAVRIVTDELASAVVAPLSVAVERAGRRTLFFVLDGRAQAVDVHDAILNGDRLILTGAVPSQELVVRGQRDLRHGAPVRVDPAILAGSGEAGVSADAGALDVRGPRP